MEEASEVQQLIQEIVQQQKWALVEERLQELLDTRSKLEFVRRLEIEWQHRHRSKYPPGYTVSTKNKTSESFSRRFGSRLNEMGIMLQKILALEKQIPKTSDAQSDNAKKEGQQDQPELLATDRRLPRQMLALYYLALAAGASGSLNQSALGRLGHFLTGGSQANCLKRAKSPLAGREKERKEDLEFIRKLFEDLELFSVLTLIDKDAQGMN